MKCSHIPLLLALLSVVTLAGVWIIQTGAPARADFRGCIQLPDGSTAAGFRVSNQGTRRLLVGSGEGTNSLSAYDFEEETVDGWFRNRGAGGGSFAAVEPGQETGFQVLLPSDGRRRRLIFRCVDQRPQPPGWLRWNLLRKALKVYFGDQAYRVRSPEILAGDPHRPGLESARQSTEPFRGARRRAIRAILDYGGFIHWDENGLVKWISLVYDDPGGSRIECTNRSDRIAASLEHLPETRELLLTGGQATDQAMQHVGRLTQLEALFMWGARMTDAGTRCLTNLHRLRRVHISNAGLTDATLAALSTLPALEEMSLQENRFTDAGLKHLAGMAHLRRLFTGIAAPGISDAGMLHLKGLTNLEMLDLQGTSVTDAGVTNLEKLQKLKEVMIEGSRITGAGAQRLQKALPNAKIWQ